MQNNLNKVIQKYDITTEAGQMAAASLKNKNRAPVEATMVWDAEGLSDEMKKLTDQLKQLVEDTKQASVNVHKGEQAVADSR